MTQEPQDFGNKHNDKLIGSIDPAQEPELARQLSEIAEKRQAEDIDKVRQESEQVTALLAPDIDRILQELRKKGVDIDSMRALLEQSTQGENPTEQSERLAQTILEQRTKILEAISEVTDQKNLARQIQALFLSERQISLDFDSVLAVTARKEDVTARKEEW